MTALSAVATNLSGPAISADARMLKGTAGGGGPTAHAVSSVRAAARHPRVFVFVADGNVSGVLITDRSESCRLFLVRLIGQANAVSITPPWSHERDLDRGE